MTHENSASAANTSSKPWHQQIAQDFCVYGASSEDANREMMEFQIFNFVVIVSVGFVFWQQKNTYIPANLVDILSPLTRLVDWSICLQLLYAVLYYLGYPYTTSFGNCAEFVVSEFATIVINYAEFCQLELLAITLGLAKYNFYIFGSLTNMICKLSRMVLLFSVACFLLFGGDNSLLHHSSMLEEFWTIFAAILQIYCIRVARSRYQYNSSDEESQVGINIMNPNDLTVSIFEKLSILQIIPAAFTLYHSISLLYFKESLGLVTMMPKFGSVHLILDSLCNLIFYLKIMIINEYISTVKIENVL